MTSFDDAQRSQRLNQPVILYTITTLEATHRFTTSAVNVTFGGATFPALTVIHDDEQVTQDPAGDELVIHLPISHPFVQRYAATGIPEQSVQVTVQELQTAASAAALTWSGPGQSLTINGHTAALRVPTATNDALKIQLPTVAAQKTCNHLLFDGNCAPNPGGDWPLGDGLHHGGPRPETFTTSREIVDVSADGLTITLDTLSDFSDEHFQFGKASPFHFTTGEFAPLGETRSIVSQVGNVVTLDMPFVATPSDMIGFNIQLVAGCDHTVATCKAKFSNVTNFGGAPQMNNAINPWLPNGLGVSQQV